MHWRELFYQANTSKVYAFVVSLPIRKGTKSSMQQTLTSGVRLGMQVISSLGRLRHKPYSQWMDDFFRRLRLEAGSMRAPALVQTVQGLAQLRSPPNDETVHFMVEAFEHSLSQFSKEELVAAADAWRRIFPALPGRPLQALVAELQRRVKFMI